MRPYTSIKEYHSDIEVLNDKTKNRSYTSEFKQEAAALVKQGYSVSKAATSLGITDKRDLL